MSYSDHDYQKFAQEIVAEYVLESRPLQDGVVKRASESQMNAHETRRLLEATNLKAHLTLFEKMSDHRYVEFDVVDPKAVGDLLFASPEPTKTASALNIFPEANMGYTVPDEYWEERRPAAEKVASESVPEIAVEAAPTWDVYKVHGALLGTKKVAEEIDVAVTEAYWAYRDGVTKLASMFSRADSSDYGTFCQEAAKLHSGTKLAQVLEDVWENLPRQVREGSNFTKSAGAYVIERDEHRVLAACISDLEKAAQMQHAKDWLAHKLDVRGRA